MGIFKKKENNEIEVLDEEIKSKKEYFDNLVKDINSLLSKKEQIRRECNSISKDIIKLKTEYDLLKNDYDELYKEVNKFTINYVDSLNGIEFEQYVTNMLEDIGYSNVKLTKASNDYGVDIVAEKDNIKYAIQCKNYNSPLGNSCVQEVYSGKKYYNCHIAVVITNSTFTANAKELAQRDEVLLWDRNCLLVLLKQYAEANNKIVKIIRSNSSRVQKNTNNSDDIDPLFDEIVDYVIQAGKISASLIQRKYRLNYNRAARIIDLLEERGIIGPPDGSKPREVLIKEIY